MDWTVLSFVQNFLERLCALNHIIFWSKFCKKIMLVLPYCLFSKFLIRTKLVEPNSILIKLFQKDYMHWTTLSFHQNFLKRQYGLNHIIFWSNVSWKTTWIELYCLLVRIFEKVSMGWTILSFSQIFWKDNVGWSTLSLGQKLLKRQYGLNHIVFWSKFSKRTALVEPYCLLVNVFLKDNMS